MKKVRPADVVIIGLSLTILFFSIFSLGGSGNGRRFLTIEGPEGEYVYSLGKNQQVKVKGALGFSTIVIEGGAARFEDSPCPNKICVHTGKIAEAGEVAACLPNRVIMHVDGGKVESELDAVVE